MPLKIVREPSGPASSTNLSNFEDFGTVSHDTTVPTRRSSFSKSAKAISGLRGGTQLVASEPAVAASCDPPAWESAVAQERDPPLFFEARLSWATSPLEAGFTFAASTIASTCFASMRVAR